MYCCCIPDGKININVSIPQQGYVPGQTIDVNVYLSGAMEKVLKLKIKLKKVSYYIFCELYLN